MYDYRAALIRVVDGDTVHLDVDLGVDIHTRMIVRLAGINCPEMNTDRGKAAKAWTQGWFDRQGWYVRVMTVKVRSRSQDGVTQPPDTEKREKYGRYLAHILSIDGTSSLTQELLDHDLAVVYNA
jgi:micrococcal nuclease